MHQIAGHAPAIFFVRETGRGDMYAEGRCVGLSD